MSSISTKSRLAEKLISGILVVSFRSDLDRRAETSVAQIDAAQTKEDLHFAPSSCLVRLAGDGQGQYSIRINQQGWVCLIREGEDAVDLESVDYHWEMIMATMAFPAFTGAVLKKEFPGAIKPTTEKVIV